MDQKIFTKFRRTQIAEMRPFIAGETLPYFISISVADMAAGSPKVGDMIARNPANHDDQWLVAAAYFAANFEPLHPELEEHSVGEAIMTGGHDEDRDGPVPFGG